MLLDAIVKYINDKMLACKANKSLVLMLNHVHNLLLESEDGKYTDKVKTALLYIELLPFKPLLRHTKLLGEILGEEGYSVFRDRVAYKEYKEKEKDLYLPQVSVASEEKMILGSI